MKSVIFTPTQKPVNEGWYPTWINPDLIGDVGKAAFFYWKNGSWQASSLFNSGLYPIINQSRHWAGITIKEGT